MNSKLVYAPGTGRAVKRMFFNSIGLFDYDSRDKKNWVGKAANGKKRLISRV